MNILFTSLVSLFALSTILFSEVGFAQYRCRNLFLPSATAYDKNQLLIQENALFKTGQNYETGLRDLSYDLSFADPAPIVRSGEKEGLYYEEIADWFPYIKETGKNKLLIRWQQEQQALMQNSTDNSTLEERTRVPKVAHQQLLHQWISKVQLKKSLPKLQKEWSKLNPDERLDFLLKHNDPFSILKMREKDQLFDDSILNFDDIERGPKAPPYVTVGDDLGSYEVRLERGLVDREQYFAVRQQIEEFLEGRIGHQHLFHGWPQAKSLRKENAPYYIELLDSTTWYLYWRQIKRDPENIDSILTHPFLGVYPKSSLDRLNKAYVNDQPEHFRDKFKMIGARSFKSSAEIPEQGEGLVPDWELRSGNKGNRREFVENLVISRLATGDFSGLRDYTSYEFDSSAPIESITSRFLAPEQIQELRQFEMTFSKMKWSPHKNAHNKYRNRILSPLLPWENRLNLKFKLNLLHQAQQKYAEELLKIARQYQKDRLDRKKHATGRAALIDANEKAIEDLELINYDFATTVRLDLDFERYLKPTPQFFPNINVKVTGAVDVNKLDSGIEYSFRMPNEIKPQSEQDARELILGMAEVFAKYESQDEVIDSERSDGHGHGIAVKYQAKDRENRDWRFEWDGIQRKYNKKGKVTNAWGGHMEVVTPKFAPTEISGTISQLYKNNREHGFIPMRSAGGAHFNFDLKQLQSQFPNEDGPRRVVNLISYHETNEPLILFLWQHPKRAHAAYPVQLKHKNALKLMNFKGSWDELGRLLYDIHYFNEFEGRKPKYVPLNLTALMTPFVPNKYLDQPIDIKNHKQKWQPHFARVTGRGEARYFDAPPDEKIAALQIKYFRAFLNHTLNHPGKILIHDRFSKKDTERWTEDLNAWMDAVENHLQELQLDPNEFRPLIWDSWLIRQNENSYPQEAHDYKKFEDFLPSQTPSSSTSSSTSSK